MKRRTFIQAIGAVAVAPVEAIRRLLQPAVTTPEPTSADLQAMWDATTKGNAQIPVGGGRMFFVDSENGDDANDGLTPDTAVATPARVYGMARRNAGDTIVVLPARESIADAVAQEKKEATAAFVRKVEMYLFREMFSVSDREANRYCLAGDGA